MSEQAKTAHVQEEIKQAKRNQTLGYAVAFVSLLVYWLTQGHFQIISGLAVIGCLAASIYYSARAAKLRRQLQAMELG